MTMSHEKSSKRHAVRSQRNIGEIMGRRIRYGVGTIDQCHRLVKSFVFGDSVRAIVLIQGLEEATAA
jgi:hypothetical protein